MEENNDVTEHPHGPLDEISLLSGVEDVSFLTGDYIMDCVLLLTKIEKLKKELKER